MAQRLVIITSLFVFVLMAVHVAGYFFPTALTWGFHFFAFLPPYLLIVYIIITLCALILLIRIDLDPLISRYSEITNKKSFHFLAIISLVVIATSVLFRVKAPLLGDSFFLVKNYAEASRGVAPLYPRNEPLATYYFSSIMDIFGVSNYKEFLNIFLFADILLGVGFVIISFLTIRYLISDTRAQILTFLFILALPYMQLFWGYVETYSMVLFVVSLYVFTSTLYVRQKIPFSILPVIFLLLALVHYLTLLLLPSLLYLTYLEIKRKGIKNILIGFGSVGVIVLSLLIAMNFQVEKFSTWVPHSHYLSLFESKDFFEEYSQAYTLFSKYHFIDLLNLLILFAPCLIYLLIVILYYNQRALLSSYLNKFFISAIIPICSFLVIVKFDLGAARDWDVFSPYIFIVALFIAYTFFQLKIHSNIKVFSILIVITLLNSSAWFYLNSTTDLSINRFKSLFDKRFLSHGGFYAASLHLAQYFHEMKNIEGPIDVWERYTDSFPEDQRGYLNLITNLSKFGSVAYKKISQTYERWIRIMPDRSEPKRQYAGFCIETGNYFYRNNEFEEAKGYFQKSLELDPTLPKGYNNLGSVYAQQREYEMAIACFQKAIELYPEYADAYYNLANVYTDIRDSLNALAFMQQAAILGNLSAQETINR